LITSGSYYDWLDSQIECEQCGWQGLGKKALGGEEFEGGLEYNCPNDCDNVIAFVMYPTLAQVLNDPRAADMDRKAATIRTSRLEKFEQDKLKFPDQLPTIDSPPETLIWDVVEEADGEFVVIRNGSQEIWRELSWFENYRRFDEIAQILRAKYGPALKDLAPTKESFNDLYGDKLDSFKFVEGIRKALADNYRTNLNNS